MSLIFLQDFLDLICIFSSESNLQELLVAPDISFHGVLFLFVHGMPYFVAVKIHAFKDACGFALSSFNFIYLFLFYLSALFLSLHTSFSQ